MTLIDSRFSVLQEINGGMGRVLICEEVNSGELRALKTIQDLASSDEDRLALRQEAEAWLRLGAGELGTFFVPLQEVFWARGDLYLVMPFYERGSLRRANLPQQPVSQAYTWLTHVLLGLWQIADKGLVHCDLKPENVLIDDARRARVSDFGISRPLQQASTGYKAHRTFSARGTLPYMAPEQLTTCELDFRTDMWAFAVIVLEAVTGRHPFALRDEAAIAMAITRQPERYLAPHLDQLPSSVRGFLEPLLSRRREDRPQDFDQVVRMWGNVITVPGSHHENPGGIVTIEDGAVRSAWDTVFFRVRDSSDEIRIQYTEIDALSQGESFYKLGKYSEAISRVDDLLACDVGGRSALNAFLDGTLPERDHRHVDRLDPGQVVILPGASAVEAALSVRLRSAVALLEGQVGLEPDEHVRICRKLMAGNRRLDQQIQVYISQVLGLSGAYVEAREVLSQLLQSDPEHVAAWNALFSVAVLEDGDEKVKAHEVARMAIGALRESQRPGKDYVLAHMCSVVGQHELAVQYAASALMEREDDLESFFLLIASLWNSGDRAAAQEFYQDLVGMAPSSPQRERLRPLFED